MHDAPSKASYTSGIFAFLIGRIADMFSNVNWADVASITGIVIGVATFLVNWYYKKKDFELKEKNSNNGSIIMIKRSAKYICAISAVVGLVIASHGNEIRTSEKGLLLIGNAEGCMKKPYQCPADVLTVGIGITDAVEKIDRNKIYTLQEIAELYVKGIKQSEKCVNQYANGKTMPQGAFDALVSITFNVGCGKLKIAHF